MSGGPLEQMWQQAENWRLIVAAISGIMVGIVYFYSLRWSVRKMGEISYNLKLFGIAALCRIALFFGVLVFIGHRNVAVIFIYIGAFFLTKLAILLFEKNAFLKFRSEDEEHQKHEL